MVGKRYGLDCTRTDPFWIDFPSAVTDPLQVGLFRGLLSIRFVSDPLWGVFSGSPYHTGTDVDDGDVSDPNR